MVEEYELESPDELRESLSEVLQEISVEQGWTPLEEELVEAPLDPLTAAIEHGRLEIEVQELRKVGKSQQGLELINRYLERVRPALRDTPAIISSFVVVLLLKVDVLVSGELVGSVDRDMLLNVLDQIKEYLYHFEPRVLQSNTRLAKRVRGALALRESLMKN